MNKETPASNINTSLAVAGMR